VHRVWTNGETVFAGGESTGAAPGRFIGNPRAA
jgi:hypothetical protein